MAPECLDKKPLVTTESAEIVIDPELLHILLENGKLFSISHKNFGGYTQNIFALISLRKSKLKLTLKVEMG